MKQKIAIIGLGYVGLPLAVEFSKKKFDVIGFDINETRIKELLEKKDNTLELTPKDLEAAKTLVFSNKIEDLKTANIYIVTVPTPITKYKTPDLTPIIKASETIAKVLNNGDLVIYESTVFPGCTE